MTTTLELAAARKALAAEVAAKLDLTAERYDRGTPQWRRDDILVHGYAAADAAIAEAQAEVDRLEALYVEQLWPVAA